MRMQFVCNRRAEKVVKRWGGMVVVRVDGSMSAIKLF